MKFGASMFFTDYSMGPAELAVALEQRGFDIVWAPEHSHIPVSRKTGFILGGDLPKRYYDVMDPFVTLTAAAMATKTLKVGTGVCLVAQRDPIQTAKLVASLDQVSGGRFVFGVGNGWNQDEMENHGTAYATRHKRARENIEAMKAIWTKSKAEYHGEFVKFDPVWSWPKPAQKPHPPILLGGETDYTLRRVVDYCDGWFPRPRGFDPVQGVDRLRRMADSRKRDFSTLTINVFGAPNDAKVLASYQKAGIQDALLAIPDLSRDEILRHLDTIAPLVKVGAAA